MVRALRNLGAALGLAGLLAVCGALGYCGWPQQDLLAPWELSDATLVTVEAELMAFEGLN